MARNNSTTMVDSMFEKLEEFNKIIVTGPQRSGTRIGAKCIAYTLGHEYVDEVDVATDSIYSLVFKMSSNKRLVIQCPALCPYVHLFGDRDDTAICIMVRPIEDIIASQERIGWTASFGQLEAVRYGAESYHPDLKYYFWIYYQSGRIRHPFEISYDDLHEHPLWVPKERRVGFGFSQTE